MEFLIALIVALLLTCAAFLSGGWVLLQYSRARRTDERGKLDQLHQHKIDLIELEQRLEIETRDSDIEQKARGQALSLAAERERTELKLLTSQAQAVIRQGQPKSRLIIADIREGVQRVLEG